jgi:diketogulonate reductase-like aldo/keto reductase
VLPWCARHSVALVAYSPFGAGRFPSPASPGARVLAEVGRARRATPHQVALAFLARNPDVLTIPKAARVAHVEEVAGAGDLVLAHEDIQRIDAAFPGPRRAGPLPVL